MARTCVFRPKDPKKDKLFTQLKKNFGYEIASVVFNKVTGEEFIDAYKDSLVFDEGVPTYDSVVSNSLVRTFIGDEQMLKAYNGEQPHLEDTVSNTTYLVNEARRFNTDSSHSPYIAFVDYDSDSNLTIKVEKRTPENVEVAESQYKIQKLNEKVAEILSPLGITMSTLSRVEVAAGRVGITNFNHAFDIANGFTGLMQIANNMEGSNAISEEFAHFLIGVYRDTPLVQRTINFLMNEDEARNVLGDEYDSVSDYYDGDTALIAEEAAGHILRNTLINREEVKKPLFKRLTDYIVNMFRRFNPGYYRDSLELATRNMSSLAEKVLSGKQKISQKDVLKARREATFNALSEKVDKQMEVLKGISERAYKLASLQENLQDDISDESQKRKARKLAESINDTFKTNIAKEETMAAIAAYLDVARDNLKDLYADLNNIDQLDVQDRFTLFKNVLYKIQYYSPTIEELKNITTDDYLNDEGIQKQEFMFEDESNSLEEYEADEDIEPMDTSSMSSEEIAEQIVKDSSEWELSNDETYYINKKTRQKAMRVTQVIAADREGESFDPDSPWATPSTNIGTGIDELVRDYLSGRIKEEEGEFLVDGEPLNKVYPNATKKALNSFVNAIKAFKESEVSKGINLISRDVTVNGTVSTIDGAGEVHKVNVVGTLDLLGYDKDGNWYIYDMKTHRGTIDEAKKAKYERQVTLYKKLLEEKYGIKIKSLSIIPIKVTYPAPTGAYKGSANYTVASYKPSLYNGRHGNQLEIDGELFKGANPTLEETMSINTRDLDIQYKKLANDPSNGLGDRGRATLDALNGVDRQFSELTTLFSEKALPQFLEYIKPFVGENIDIREFDKNGKPTGKMKTVSIEQVIKKAPKDVSLAQRWVTSMADNPDALLQIFDKVVKIAKDEKRQKVIQKTQEILALGKEFEGKGIRSYEWMFESDKANYVNYLVVDGKDYSYDKASYETAKKKFIEGLNSKYGEHPEVGSNEYKSKKKELKEWINANTVSLNKDGDSITIPDPKTFPSKYENFTDTQKEFYRRWMAIKAELDALIGPDKTYLTNTIKIRKSGIERLSSSVSGHAITEFVENVKSKVIRSFDDDTSYVDAKGIRGFKGEEIMKLPLYYINAKSSEDLSTDVIGTLVAYTEMAYNYNAMSQVVNPLEIGRFLTESRKINSTRGDKRVFEDFNFAGKHTHNPLYEDVAKSNFRKVLDDFFESKIYGRYLVDSGEIAGVDKNKAAGILLKLGSAVQLGFNVLAGFANVATGLAMQNIEAVASEFFNARELAAADKEFVKAMPEYTAEIGRRIKTSKLALFDEMFDVKQNYTGNIKHKNFLNRFLLTRIFGPHIQYICQGAGDHWLYNRSAIAMAKRYKLKDKNGKSISLWDALVTVPINSEHPEYGKKLVLKDGVTKEDGTAFTSRDKADLSGRMRYVNQHCFGIYNEEDSIGARRTIIGRFLMQYRDWIPAQFRYRFGVMTTNLEKGGKVEGYYRTSARFLKNIYSELKNGEKTLPQIWGQLEDFEKANIKRAVTEVSQYITLLIIAGLLKGGDKDRPWLEKMVSYTLTREKTELGALIPLSMPKEMINIMKSPFANTNVISDIYNLSLLVWPPNYTDEIKGGDYKGHSSAYRAFMRSPLTLYYRTIKRSLDPEKAESFFDRN